MKIASSSSTVLSLTQFLFPGLIDTYVHAPQYPNLALGMEGTIGEWVRNSTDPMEASYQTLPKQDASTLNSLKRNSNQNHDSGMQHNNPYPFNQHPG